MSIYLYAGFVRAHIPTGGEKVTGEAGDPSRRGDRGEWWGMGGWGEGNGAAVASSNTLFHNFYAILYSTISNPFASLVRLMIIT